MFFLFPRLFNLMYVMIFVSFGSGFKNQGLFYYGMV